MKFWIFIQIQTLPLVIRRFELEFFPFVISSSRCHNFISFTSSFPSLFSKLLSFNNSRSLKFQHKRRRGWRHKKNYKFQYNPIQQPAEKKHRDRIEVVASANTQGINKQSRGIRRGYQPIYTHTHTRVLIPVHLHIFSISREGNVQHH